MWFRGSPLEGPEHDEHVGSVLKILGTLKTCLPSSDPVEAKRDSVFTYVMNLAKVAQLASLLMQLPANDTRLEPMLFCWHNDLTKHQKWTNHGLLQQSTTQPRTLQRQTLKGAPLTNRRTKRSHEGPGFAGRRKAKATLRYHCLSEVGPFLFFCFICFGGYLERKHQGDVFDNCGGVMDGCEVLNVLDALNLRLPQPQSIMPSCPFVSISLLMRRIISCRKGSLYVGI